MNDLSEADNIAQVAQHLQQAQRVLFITGAGLSADSGLPTYRGIGGLYQQQDTEDRVPIEVALSYGMLRTHPALTWKYLLQIEQACRGVGYNRGHEVIAKLAQDKEVWVLTQNIDGFHHAAGSPNLIEIHGRLQHIHCMSCKHKEVWPDFSHLQLENLPPVCPACGGILRPAVVLFGEMLSPLETLSLTQQVQQGFDIVFSVGTSSLFPYIVAPVLEAKHDGVPTVEINPGKTEISNAVDYRLRNRAAKILDDIWNTWKQMS